MARSFGHGAMECGIEAGVLRHCGQEFFCLADEPDRSRDVDRRELDCGLQGLQQRRRDSLMFAQMRSAMDHAMSKSVGLLSCALGYRVEDLLHRLPLGVEAVGFVDEGFAGGIGDLETPVGVADAACAAS